MTLKKYIENDWSNIEDRLFIDAELGIDTDDEGRSSDCIDNWDTILDQEAELTVVSMIEDAGADPSDDELNAMMDAAKAIIEAKADYSEVLERLQDSNTAYHEQWSDYYTAVAGGIR